MSNEAKDYSVGVIGLGKMGHPIARRFRSAGYTVVAHDVREDAREAAAASGIGVVACPREVAAGTDVSLVLVGFDDEARQVVVDGVHGLLAGARPGHTILIGSTVSPATSRAIGRAAERHGVEVLDTALCRGEGAAVDGTLLILGGGRLEVFERLRPLLGSIGSDVHHLGPLGAGQVAKMINNYLLWLNVVGNYEGLRLAARMDVDLGALREALLKSSGANWALETWERARPMPWAEKDMAILMECADEQGLPMAAAGSIRELIKQIKIEKSAWLDGAGVDRSMDDLVRNLEGL
ncbi:MAG: 6-phosphogluconate dehydrogenase [Sphaerisporangium sp.]|nr:6-phosphogluconate dehydrogenase [Sphaerisporangium sp.]